MDWRGGLRLQHESRGYSLVELLVVLAVLGILAMLAQPWASMSVQRSKEQELRRALWEIRTAIDAFHEAQTQGWLRGPQQTRSGYPAALEDLCKAWPDTRPGHVGEHFRFLRAVPPDPFADPALPAAAGWGLRSFASEAEQPRAGDDVYDVYSRSNGTALNGVPLRRW